MPLALSIGQRQFDCLTITDFSDGSAVNFSAKMMFGHMHFGADPNSLDPNEHIGTVITEPPTLRASAQALGLTIDNFRVAREFARPRSKVELSRGAVEAGTVALRMQVEALHSDRVLVRRRSTWNATKDIHADWDLRETGFHHRVAEDVPLDVLVKFDVPREDFPVVGGRITANPGVNSIPYVCEAAPGSRQTNEVPLLVPNFER